MFKSDRLMIMCQQLIYKYFLLTPAELEIWDSDPEMFGKWFIINILKTVDDFFKLLIVKYFSMFH